MPPHFFFNCSNSFSYLDGAGWTQLTDPVVDLGQFLGQAHASDDPYAHKAQLLLPHLRKFTEMAPEIAKILHLAEPVLPAQLQILAEIDSQSLLHE